MIVWAKRLGILVYWCIATLILLEIAVRIWGYSERYIYDPIYMPFEASEDIPFVHKPNLENARARGNAIIHTDSLGLRSTESGTTYGPKAPNEYRIAIIGDSITFGEGIENTADTYSQLLEVQLNAAQNQVQVQVFNFGVSAYSIKTMVATLEHRVLEIEPDLVLLAIIPPDFYLGRTGVIDKWGYNANANTSQLIDQDSQLKRWLRDVHLTYLIRDLRRMTRVRQELPTEFSDSNWLLDGYDYVPRFRDFAEANYTTYRLVLLSTYFDRGFSEFYPKFEQDEIAYIDLSDLARSFSENEYNASRFDGHPSVLVHKAIADRLTEPVLTFVR